MVRRQRRGPDRCRLALALLAAGGAPADAASPWQTLADPVFVRADTRELPEAAVMALAQDSAGFLWVGTQGGLARFDGDHFRSSNGLDGAWVGGDGGLDRFDPRAGALDVIAAGSDVVRVSPLNAPQ